MSIVLVLTALLGLQALALIGLALLAQEGMVRLPKGRTRLGSLRGATVGAGPSTQTAQFARKMRAEQKQQLRAARLINEASARMNAANPSKRVLVRLEGLESKASRRARRREEARLAEEQRQHPRLEERRAKRAAARQAQRLRWRKPVEVKVRTPKQWGNPDRQFTAKPQRARAVNYVVFGARVAAMKRRLEFRSSAAAAQARREALAQEWAGLEIRARRVASRIKSISSQVSWLENSLAAAQRQQRAAQAAAYRWQTAAAEKAAAKAVAEVDRQLEAGHERRLRAEMARLEGVLSSLRRAQAVVDIQLSTTPYYMEVA